MKMKNSKSIVYIRIHSWHCPFCGFRQMYTDVCPSLWHPVEYFHCPSKSFALPIYPPFPAHCYLLSEFRLMFEIECQNTFFFKSCKFKYQKLHICRIHKFQDSFPNSKFYVYGKYGSSTS